MEPVYETLEVSSVATEDVISSMPDNVITHILDRLPIQYAVRTSILSRNWRFKWTMLSQVVFDYDFFEYLLGPDHIINYDARHLSRLLHFNGAITKFVLYIPSFDLLDFEDIHHWVMLLSRKGIKDFTLISENDMLFKLPTHFFSCLELKHLTLYNCHIRPPPSFHGFPNLLNLVLCYVTFEGSGCMDLIRGCPLLEILRIPNFHPIGTLKLDGIARLKNLKILSFSLRELDNNVIKCSCIFRLVGFLPKLQELGLTLLMGETLEIMAIYENDVPPPAICFSEIHCNSMGRLQLRSVEFTHVRGSKNEICLIEWLLASSPLLEKMVIHFDPIVVFGGDDGKYKFARKLLKLQRASPIAQLKLK
ncbi:F-box/FBD/LRR-repeat protein-like protein [Tanacetum coccineum]|uniref:F-box/FBD/LRR-repeat protein-like protein n=1 Tax=Tanacetum coccineum TaxID=301880 RepID=A0ABQ5CQD6_9ASTR